MKEFQKKIVITIGMALLLIAVVIINSGGIKAYGVVSGDYRYSVNDDNQTITLLKYTGNEKTVILPETIDGYTVTILDSTFTSNKTVETVVLPKNVIRIRGYCFYYCENLQKVVLNDKLQRIGPETFSSCINLKEVNLPSSLFLIEKEAFYNCKSLVEINIPSRITEIYSSTFEGCTSLTTVTLPDGIITIGTNAFLMCSSLKNFNLPTRLVELKEGAIRGCNSIKELYIPDSLKILQRPDVLPQKIQYYAKEGTEAYEILSATENITLVPKVDVSKLTFNYAAEMVYSGNNNRQSLTVKYGKVILKENTDYTVTYKNNTDVGLAQIIIETVGKYTGNKTLSYKILPKAVTGVTQTSYSSSAVKLQWNTVPGTIDGYRVYRYDPVTKKTVSLYCHTNSIVDSGLAAAGNYTYKVCAYKKVNGSDTIYGAVSNGAEGITSPGLVSDFRWQDSKNDRISLRWDKSADKVTGYQIYKYNENKDKFILLKTIPQASRISWTNMYLKSNTKCRYKIRAYLTVNGKNYYGSLSNEIQAITSTATPKYKLESDKKGEIKITWDKVSGATGYTLFYKSDGDGKWKQLTNSQYTGNSYTKKNLQSGKKYYFYLKAVNNYNGVKVKSSAYFKNKTAK